MKFKGFGDWIEIFRGGKQVDSEGREHDGDEVIAKAIATFDPGTHEPPITVGHPKNNDPAFGWVEGLKTVVKDGVKVLLMKAKQVVPDFEDLVKQGRYKKRSASFYPDGRLRHVGFLGAAPPAVKGLADLSFNDDDDAITFDFYDPGMNIVARILRNLRDYLIEKEGKDQADSIIPDWDVEHVKDEANQPKIETSQSGVFTDKKEGEKMTFKEFLEVFKFWKEVEKNPDAEIPATGASGQFSEADLEKAKADAKAEAKKEADAEYAEKESEKTKKARDKEISDWAANGVKEGKLLPAWVDSGLVAFAQSLDAEKTFQFAEGDAGKKSQWQWLKDFFETFKEAPIFKEMALKVEAGNSAEFAEVKKESEAGLRIAARVNPKK